jgi:hypothetical protein
MTATKTPHHAKTATSPRGPARGGAKTSSFPGSQPEHDTQRRLAAGDHYSAGEHMTGFKEIVGDVLEHSARNDPNELAEEIMGRLTLPQIREGLALALPEYVRHAFHRITYTPDPDPSRRVRQAAGAWDRHKQLLAVRKLGLEDWKPFGEFTAADCTAAAELRRLKASESTARAVKFDATAEAVVAAGVACVADLPADVLLGLWGSHDLGE